MIYAALALPVFQLVTVCRLATLKAPLMNHSCAIWIPRFLKEQQVRTDVVIEETRFCLGRDRSLVRSGVTHSLRASEAWIQIDRDFQGNDPEACRWAIKHSIGQIKYNTRMQILGASIVCQVAMGVLGMMVLPMIPALALTYVAGFGSLVLLGIRRERQVEQFALETCSEAELRGGIRYLTALQISAPSKVAHGALSARIQAIQKKLKTPYHPTDKEIVPITSGITIAR